MMRLKIIVLVLAAAVSVSAFCFTSCEEEAATLKVVQYPTENEMEDEEDISDDSVAEEEDMQNADSAADGSVCEHILTHYDEVAATCKAVGKKEHWYCTECECYFLDEEAAAAVDLEEIVIESTEHSGAVSYLLSCIYGERILKCSICEDTIIEEIAATGEHDYGDWVVTEATCKSDGKKVRTCKNCGEYQTEKIEQLKHNYVPTIVQESTCTKAGVTYYECSYCNDYYYKYPVALGHNLFKVEAQAATCTENGWEEYEICTRCKYIPSYTARLAAGHDYEENVVEPTTDTEGYTEYACQICNYSYIANYTEKLTYTLKYVPTSDGDGYIVAGFEDGSECADLVIPDYYSGVPVTEIAASAFYGNTDITSVTIGENVTTIGASAFAGCTNITEIHYNAVSARVSALGTFNNAGRDSGGITLYVGSSVVSIPDKLFAGISYTNNPTSANITEIEFVGDSSLTTIGAYAFAGCNNLQRIYIPSACTGIGEGAFAYCTSLTYASVPESANCEKDSVFIKVASGFELEIS